MSLINVASAQVAGIAAPSVTLTFTEPTEGNFMFASVTRNLGTDDIDTPAGWTKLFSSLHSSATTACFWKIAGASEGTTQEFTSSTSGGKWAVGYVEYSGQSTTPINASATNTGLDDIPTSPALITDVANCELIAGFGTNNYVSVFSVDAGLNSKWNQSTSSGGSVGTAGGAVGFTSADLTEPFVHSMNASQDWFAYTVAIEPASGVTTLQMDSGDISLSGTDATFINESLTSEPQSLWFPAGTWKEPTFGQVTWGAPGAGESYTLACDSGDISLSGTDASFTLFIGDLTLSMDSGDISLSGTDAAFDVQSIVRTADVQAALDELLQPDTIDIYIKQKHLPNLHWYCVGIRTPYMGKAFWVKTLASDSPTDQALEISQVMLQDGNYDPDFS